MNNKVGDGGWWRDMNKIENIKNKTQEQTIQNMRSKKGKKSGGNRLLANWQQIAKTKMKLTMDRNALANNRN